MFEFIWNTFVLVGSFTTLLTGLFFISYAKRDHNPEDRYPAWTDGTMIFLLGVLVLHGGLYWLLPNFWYSWFNQPGWILYQLMIALGIRFVFEKREGMGYAVIVLGIIGLCLNTYRASPTLQVWWKGKGNTADTTLVASTSNDVSLPLLPENPEGMAIVEKFFLERLKPEADAREMIEILRKESGGNQFEADGVTPYQGRVDPMDTGACQINRRFWEVSAQGRKGLAQGLGYDIHGSLQDNLEMCLWIYHRMGPGAWKASGKEPRPFNVNDFTIEAPVAPEISDRVPAWKETKGTIVGEGSVLVFDDHDNPHEMDQNNIPEMPLTYYVRYQSRTNTPVTVRIVTKK